MPATETESDDQKPRRLRLRWDRTVIGGKTAPQDFSAWDGERYPSYAVARIYWREGGNIGDGWFWTMPLIGATGGRSYGPGSGTVETKDEAARECEAAYFRFLAVLEAAES